MPGVGLELLGWSKAQIEAIAGGVVPTGLSPKQSVARATAATLPTNVYANGSSGVGATLTETLVGELEIDGAAVTVGQRVLVKNEAEAKKNGIYTVTIAGGVAEKYVLTRSTDLNTTGQFDGAFVFVEIGTKNEGSGWVIASSTPVTVGTTEVLWTQFTGAGEVTVEAPIEKTGNKLSLSPSVVSGSQHWINIANYRAVSGEDCTAAIQAAQTAALAAAGHYGLFFPEGAWIYKETLKVEVPWKGIPRKSILKMNGSEFTYGGGGSWAIKNNGFNTTFAGGNYIEIDGVDFIFNNLTGSEKQGVGLGAISGGHLKDCQLKTEGTGKMTTLDIFACSSNLVFEQVRCANTTEAENSAACWVRNRCETPTTAKEAVENLTFNDCSFTGSTKDEAIAVFASGGAIRHVRLNRCKVEALSSSKKHNHIASTFLGTNSGELTHCIVEDVEWNDCQFIDTTGNINAGNNVLVFGQTADEGVSGTKLQDISHVNCTFTVQTAAATVVVARAIANNHDGASSGLRADTPTINATGSEAAVTALEGFTTVTNPRTVGKISVGCKNCGEVIGTSNIEAETETLNASVPGTSHEGIFGDGHDGALVFDGSTTILGIVPSGKAYALTRDIFATTLVINAEVIIKTESYRLFASTSVVNNGTIENNGGAGATSGAKGAGTASKSFVQGAAGGEGAEAAVGGNGSGTEHVATGKGGKGGSGETGAHAGGTGVAALTTSMNTQELVRNPFFFLVGSLNFAATTVFIGGGGGGGAGGGASGHKGGGGGAGGGVIAIFSPKVTNGATGLIQAKGGQGAAPAAGKGGGGGGGAGGIIVVYTLTPITQSGVVGVAGGIKGGKLETGGEEGEAGTEGTYVNVVLA